MAGVSKKKFKGEKPVLPYTHKCINVMTLLEARYYGHKLSNKLEKNIQLNTIEQLKSAGKEFELEHLAAVNSIDLDKSGRYLLSGDLFGILLIHDKRSVRLDRDVEFPVVSETSVDQPPTSSRSDRSRLRPPYGPCTSVETVQWYPFDSGMFFSGGLNKKIQAWDSNVMKTCQTWDFPSSVNKLHVSPANGRTPQMAVATAEREVRLVDVVSGQHCGLLTGHKNSLMCCQWSPTDINLLATGSQDCAIRLWDVRSSKSCLTVLDKDNKQTDKVDCGLSSRIKSHQQAVSGFKFTPNGRLLISMGLDKVVRCWDMHTSKNLNIPFEKVKNSKNRSIEIAACGNNNDNYCFIPDQQHIVTYHVESGRKIKTLSGHYDEVRTCYFNQDRMELFSGGRDRKIIMWIKEVPADDTNDFVDDLN